MDGDSASSATPGPQPELFQDWELLQSGDSDVAAVNPQNTVENPRTFDEIEGDYSEGMIRADYFSLDNGNRYAKTSLVDVSEEGSVESDNPSWIDPGPETQYERKNLGEFWSDSGSDRSEERKFGDFDGKNELGFVENVKTQAGSEGIGEMESKSDSLMKFGDFDGKNELGSDEKLKTQVGFGGFGETRFQDKDLGAFWSDSGGDGLVLRSFEGVDKESHVSSDDHAEKEDETVVSDGGNGLVEANSSVVIEETKSEAKSAGEDDKRRIAWWKVPFEVLRYCVLKVNPVWSFSVAATLLGLVVLGRRLYKMKRKSSSLQLKVALDDKKVSQFMTRAARLNEAFSVVRRVPIVRPALSAAGVNPWPVMGLR